VAPGQYRFSVPDLPFITGGAQSVVVNSAQNDTSSVSTPLSLGSIDARYVDLRDFMGQNLRRGITAAATRNNQSVWNNGQGEWQNFTNVKVALNTAGDQLTVRATNPSNQNVQATLPVNDPKVILRGTEGEASLFRIRALPSELNFVNSTTAATTTTPSSSSSTPAGEGEGSGMAAPPINSSSSSSSSNSLSPTVVDQVIKDVKQPERNLAASSSTPMKPAAVDAFMAATGNAKTTSSNPISNGFRRGFRTR
jgi:hypothetical protein